MMTWCYRVVKHPDCFGLHEVHTKRGKTFLCGKAILVSDSLKGLLEQNSLAGRAICNAIQRGDVVDGAAFGKEGEG